MRNIDPLQDKAITEAEALEFLLSRWQIVETHERTQIAMEVTEKVFHKKGENQAWKEDPLVGSSWLEFDDESLEPDFEELEVTNIESSTPNAPPMDPGLTETPQTALYFDLLDASDGYDSSARGTELFQLEDILDDMLNECVQALSLSALPLRAPVSLLGFQRPYCSLIN